MLPTSIAIAVTTTLEAIEKPILKTPCGCFEAQREQRPENVNVISWLWLPAAAQELAAPATLTVQS